MFVLMVCVSSAAAADFDSGGKVFSGFSDGNWGFSGLVGEPSGIRYSYFLNWKHALSASLGYSFANVAQLSVDYLFYSYSTRDQLNGENFWNALLLYGGPGVLGGTGMGGNDPNDNLQLALRFVGGAEYIFTGSPWSVRLEAAPEIFAKGKNVFGISVAVGITYYIFDDFDRRPVKKLYQIKTHRDD